MLNMINRLVFQIFSILNLTYLTTNMYKKKKSIYGLYRPSFVLVGVVILLVVVSYLITSWHDTIITLSGEDKVAIIYAGPTFHEEVTSSVSCVLHELGYKVVVYIGNGVHIGGVMIPFTGRRWRLSNRFYGSCVDQFVSVRSPLLFVPNPSIVVFVTYPMLVHDFRYDKHAFELLAHLKSSHTTAPVVLISHHSNSFLLDVELVESYIPVNQTTYMFLAAHVEKEAQREMASQKRSGPRKLLRTDHFYPIMPLHHVLGDEQASALTSLRPHQSEDTVFAVQGHFGGKHARRKNPKATMSCIRGIETQQSWGGQFARSVGGGHHRVDGRDMVMGRGSMLRHHQQSRSLRGQTNTTQAAQISPDISRQLTHQHMPLNIDFVGKLTGPVNLGHLQHGRVRFLSGLESPEYLAAIAQSRFVVTSLNDDTYTSNSATSSVPAALIASVPIVTKRSVLQLYPCLRDAPVHILMNRESECESIRAATQLTDEQYRQAKREVQQCSEELWSSAKETFRRIAGSTGP